MSEPKTLTLADIESACDLQPTPLEVPEWGGNVYLRALPARRGIELEETMKGLQGSDHVSDAIYHLLGATLCDEQGNAMFDSFERAKEILGQRNAAVLVRIQENAMRHLGWEVPKDAASPEAPGPRLVEETPGKG